MAAAPSPPGLGRYLGLHVGVVVVLEQERGGFGVILPGGDVQSWQPHLPFGVILQQDGHCLVVALLECHGQRRKAILVKQEKTIFRYLLEVWDSA